MLVTLAILSHESYPKTWASVVTRRGTKVLYVKEASSCQTISTVRKCRHPPVGIYRLDSTGKFSVQFCDLGKYCIMIMDSVQ